MAENKKGFILYADQKELFDQLPNDKAGELIKHIFKYVNDEKPITKDMLINLAFTPIKQQFKRDLVKWETTREGRSKAGKASAEARRIKKEQALTNSTNVDSVKQSSTNPTVTVNDNVTVTVNVKENKDKEADFKKSLQPFLEKYGKELLNNFFLYWTEKNPNGKKMKFEMQKTFDVSRRLAKWKSNNFNSKNKTSQFQNERRVAL
jgi:hypothetical protein